MVLGLNALDLTRLRAQIHALHCVVFLQKLLCTKVLGALHSDVLMGGDLIIGCNL